MRHFALVLIVMALAVRARVPAGWMPSGERSFALTVCTGTETSTVWIDAKGAIHKSEPVQDGGHGDVQHDPCSFAGVALALDVPEGLAPAAEKILPEKSFVSLASSVTIGHGLAAPPPPATGPPALI